MNEESYPIKYTGEECSKCGRVRVEIFSCGKKVCEKCHWDQEKNEYEDRYY